MRRAFPRIRLVFVSLLAVVSAASMLRAAELPAEISDEAFWTMISDFSEPNGYFRFENFLSNELAYQKVIPTLKKNTKAGGVYIGVGPEQNFTYVVALQPKIAFIVDIRRQNLLRIAKTSGTPDGAPRINALYVTLPAGPAGRLAAHDCVSKRTPSLERTRAKADSKYKRGVAPGQAAAGFLEMPFLCGQPSKDVSDA